MAAGAAAALVVAAGATGAVLSLAPDGDPVTAVAEQEPVATAEVARGTLRLVQEVAGMLGYGAPTPVAGRGDGIVTWLPSEGVRVERGQQLFRVDDSPVALFYGDLPMYRTLQTPQKPKDPLLTGADVDLVAANLTALGYYWGSVEDATYGSTLAGAVADWQEARELPGTGVLTVSDVVVTSGPVRVDEVLGRVGGDAASGDVLTMTTTDRVLTLAVPPDVARGLEPGRAVRVVLADGSRVRTTINHIGGRATDEDGSGEPTVAVTVEAVRPRDLIDAPLGPVSAEVVTARHNRATYVPITALLALSGGGYGVELADHSLVAVKLGMVTEGRVEVTGVTPGTTVVVAP